MIRVAIADDHPIVLDGLEQLFRIERDFEVVAQCRDGAETVARVIECRPHLLVLDIRMPKMDGIAVLEAIQREHLPTRTMLLTAALEATQIVEALRLGARGLVLKETAPDVVIEAARKIHAGGQWFEPSLLARVAELVGRRDDGTSALERTLTPREIEIVRMVAQGLRNRAISDRLGITEGTVKLHLHHVYEKLALTGRMELLLFAQKQGL